MKCFLVERAVGEVEKNTDRKRSTALSTFPQSSTGAEIDGVMRSGGWGLKKATICRPSASTGTKVSFSNGARAPSRALTRI